MAKIIPFHVPPDFHLPARSFRVGGPKSVTVFHPAKSNSPLASWRILGLTLGNPEPSTLPNHKHFLTPDKNNQGKHA